MPCLWHLILRRLAPAISRGASLVTCINELKIPNAVRRVNTLSTLRLTGRQWRDIFKFINASNKAAGKREPRTRSLTGANHDYRNKTRYLPFLSRHVFRQGDAG